VWSSLLPLLVVERSVMRGRRRLLLVALTACGSQLAAQRRRLDEPVRLLRSDLRARAVFRGELP
jgi:hypothetical protein